MFLANFNHSKYMFITKYKIQNILIKIIVNTYFKIIFILQNSYGLYLLRCLQVIKICLVKHYISHFYKNNLHLTKNISPNSTYDLKVPLAEVLKVTLKKLKKKIYYWIENV